MTRAAARLPTIGLGLGLAWIAAFLSFALAVVHPYFLNMFWQIPDGLEILSGHLPTTVSYAISSGPLVPQEWLFEAALAWFVRANAYGAFALLCAAAAAATPLLVYALVRAFGISDVAAGAVAFLAIGARFAGSATRPETFAVDAFAIELLVLANVRGLWWLLPTVVLWANLHASVVLAPLAALLFAVAELFARRGIDAHVRKAFGVAALATLATLLTPNGFRLWSYALSLTLGNNPVREHLDTWRALAFDVPGSVTAVLPGLLVLVCCGAVMQRRYTGELSVATLCLALTITHARYDMFLVVAWAPVIARALEQRTPLSALALRRPLAPIIALAPLAFYAVLQGYPTLKASAETPGPWHAAAALAADYGLHGNAYAPYVWAAYLHWRGLPLRLLIDAHGDPYAKDVWDDHLALEKVRANWRDVLTRRHLDVIIAPIDTPLAQALVLEPSWRRVASRAGIAAFTRR